MTDLFSVTQDGVAPITGAPFLDEVNDLEDFVIANPSLLGEGTTIVARQVNAGTAGRLDILALTTTPGGAQITVVELKNEPASIHVLLQALRYASWAVSNPDSIRLLLANSQVEAGSVDLHPRIVVAAPVIQDELVELSQYVRAFEFDFVEIRRFVQNTQTFVVVSHKTPSASPPAGVSAREDWDWDRYETDLGWKPDRIAAGQRLLERVLAKVEDKGWPLSLKFRKGYAALQLTGTKNVIAIEPRTLKEWWLWFRLPQPPERLGLPKLPQFTKWGSDFKVFYISIGDPEEDLQQFDDYFEAAYGAASNALPAK